MSENLINLPTEPVAVEKIEPVVLIMYGATKVGKTGALASLPGNLIIDLERGAETYECLRIRVDSYTQFWNTCEAIKNQEHIYPFITIDTLDRLVEWVEASVVNEWNAAQTKVKDPQIVKSYTEIAFGKGYDLVRIKMRTWINHLKKLTPRLILVGHLKRTIIGDTSVEVKEDNLDLVGKLRSLICADADAVGYAFRSKEGDNPALKLSFKASENTAAGSRLPSLAGQIITLTELTKDGYKNYWDKIYKLTP